MMARHGTIPPMSFKIDIQPAGLQFQVERDQAILPAAIAAGVGLPYGCRDGACGSCKSKLVSGRVIHGAHQLKALSAAEEEAGLILTCCATPQTDCVIESRSVAAAGEFPIMKIPVRVATLNQAAPDVMMVRLQLPANASFQYKAGQYVEFLLRDGKRRAYSMANAPHLKGEPPQIELHIRHMPGGLFTDALFSTVKEKDIMRVEGPFGTFWLREDSRKPIVLLASGTGLAPIKALIEQMQLKQDNRPAVLFWGCRRSHDLYLHEWAEQAAASMPNLRYVPVLSEAGPDWRGRTGFVHEAVMQDLPDLSGHEVYACGAPVMVDAARRDFSARCGLPEDAFYADSFTSEADKV
jgi:CDP-4-dehydro-6-deoxyglucose reductase, E3